MSRDRYTEVQITEMLKTLDDHLAKCSSCTVFVQANTRNRKITGLILQANLASDYIKRGNTDMALRELELLRSALAIEAQHAEYDRRRKILLYPRCGR